MENRKQGLIEIVKNNTSKLTQKSVLDCLSQYFEGEMFSLEKEEFEKMNRDEKRDLAKTILNNLESEEPTLDEAQEENER